jgi:hypothetical protein
MVPEQHQPDDKYGSRTRHNSNQCCYSEAVRSSLEPAAVLQPGCRKADLECRKHNRERGKRSYRPSKLAPKERIAPRRPCSEAADHVSERVCWRREPVDDVESTQPQLSISVAHADVAESDEVDVVEKGVQKLHSVWPGNVLRQQTSVLRDREVALVAHEPGIREQQTTRRLVKVKVMVRAQMLAPVVVVEQVVWQRLDEDLRFKPDKMLVRVLGEQYAAAEELLSVQGSCRVRQASKPEMAMDGVEPWRLQVEAQIDIGRLLRPHNVMSLVDDRRKERVGQRRLLRPGFDEGCASVWAGRAFLRLAVHEMKGGGLLLECLSGQTGLPVPTSCSCCNERSACGWVSELEQGHRKLAPCGELSLVGGDRAAPNV